MKLTISYKQLPQPQIKKPKLIAHRDNYQTLLCKNEENNI